MSVEIDKRKTVEDLKDILKEVTINFGCMIDCSAGAYRWSLMTCCKLSLSRYMVSVSRENHYVTCISSLICPAVKPCLVPMC